MGLDDNLESKADHGLTTLLEELAARIASDLELPIGFDGRPFVFPAGPALLCKVERQTARAAAIGADAPIRIDGALKISVSTLASDPVGPDLSECVAVQIPKGHGIDYEGFLGSGEIVFSTPQILEPRSDAGRIFIDVTFGFYAIIFPGA